MTQTIPTMMGYILSWGTRTALDNDNNYQSPTGRICPGGCGPLEWSQ